MSQADKNYITPSGLQRLRDELKFLLTRERPAVTQVVAWAAGNGDRSENADYLYGKRRLREIDRRIRFLRKSSIPKPRAAAVRRRTFSSGQRCAMRTTTARSEWSASSASMKSIWIAT